MLRGALWRHYHDRARANEVATSWGRVFGYVLVAFGLIEVLAGAPAGLWLSLLGWFIVAGAAGERMTGRYRRLDSWTAEQVMSPTPVTVSDWWTVPQFLAGLHPGAAAQPVYPVADFGGEITGMLALRDLRGLPQQRRDEARIRDLVRRRPPLVVTCDTTLADIVPKLPRHGGVAVVVDEGRRPVGVITANELERGAHLAELGWSAAHLTSGAGRPGA